MKNYTIPLLLALLLFAVLTSLPFKSKSQTLVADETYMTIGKNIKIETYNDFIYECMTIDLKAKAKCIRTYKIDGRKIRRYTVVLPLHGLEYVQFFFKRLNEK